MSNAVAKKPYPTKLDLLRLCRDVLDQKPQAIELVKTVSHSFQMNTLESALQLANAYLERIRELHADPR